MCKGLLDLRGSEMYLSAGDAHDHNEFGAHFCGQVNNDIKYFEGMRGILYSKSRDQHLIADVSCIWNPSRRKLEMTMFYAESL